MSKPVLKNLPPQKAQALGLLLHAPALHSREEVPRFVICGNTMFLLDTNIILDACFVKGSWSREALLQMNSAGAKIATTPMVVHEAKRRVMAYLTALRNPRPYFKAIENLVIHFRIELVSDIGGDVPECIPKNDRFLWPTCANLNCTLVTRDLSLLEAFREVGAYATVPLEIIGNGQPASRYAFSGVKPLKEAGTLYFHGHDSYWTTNVNEPVCLFNWGNDLVMDFVPTAKMWVLCGDAFPRPVEFRCKSAVSGHIDKKVVVTWSSSGLYIYDSAEAHPKHEPSIQELSLNGNKCSLSGKEGRKHSFMGTVKALVFDDRNMDSKFWKKIKDKDHAFTPQPFDNDRLNAVLRG